MPVLNHWAERTEEDVEFFFIFNLFFYFILKIIHRTNICSSNSFGRVGPRGATKTRCRATCIGVTRCATLARFGALGRGLPAHIPRVNLVTPLPPAWQYSLVTPPPLAWQGLTLEKSYLFHTNSDGDDFYTKIVALNEIYNFIVLSFFIWSH